MTKRSNELFPVKQEYLDSIDTLHSCLRQHAVYCMLDGFDQVLQSDKLTVTCCACDKEYKVSIDQVAINMFCEDCRDTEVTKEHMQKSQARLLTIKSKLL